MSCFGVFITVTFLVVLLYSLSAGKRQRASQRRRLLQGIAAKFNGLYVGGSWMTPPSVRLRYGEANVVVEPLGQRNVDPPGQCQIRMTWPGIAIHCDIRSKTLAHAPVRGWRQKTIHFDSGPLSDGYEIATDDPGRTQMYLTESVRWEIHHLTQIPETTSIRFLVSREKMTCERYGGDTQQPVEDTIRQCFRIYDQIRLAYSQGISFLNQDTATVVNEALCPICGEKVVDDLVFCRNCKTVHHGECWRYNGRCSTYGCGEVTFVSPPRADVLPSDELSS